MQREENKRFSDTDKPKSPTSSSSMDQSLRIAQNAANHSVVSGNLHQGDALFENPGIQCTYLSFYALICMKNKDPFSWTVKDINSCIIDGNERYLQHCTELKIEPRMLLVNELPKSIRIHETSFECNQQDSNIMVGTVIQGARIDTSTGIFVTLENAIIRGFEYSDSCLLVCGGQTLALAKHQTQFLVFDPHSRDKDGFVHPTGNAVLISFSEIKFLIVFLMKLFIDSRQLKPSEQFELVPLILNAQYNYLSEQVKDTTHSKKDMSDDHSCKKDKNKTHSSVLYTQSCNQKCQMQNAAILQNRDLHLYFADQEKRNRIQKEKISSEKGISENKRKEYMRSYMKTRREIESFRRNDNETAKLRMRKIQATQEGRMKNCERASEGMKKIRSVEEGREKNKKRAAEGMQRIRDTEEGKANNRKRAAKGMKRIYDTKEGKQTNRERAAKGMKRLRCSDEYLRDSQIRDTKRKRKLREDDSFKEHERMQKKQKRLDNMEDTVKKKRIF